MSDDADKVPFLPRSDKPESSASSYHDEEKGGFEEEARLRQGQNRSRRPRYACWELTAFLLAIWGIVALGMDAVRTVAHLKKGAVLDVYHPDTLRPGLNLCDCGNTTEQALARKCVYDALATAWLPPHCRDDELTAEFDRAGPGPEGQWPYYADQNGTVVLNQSQIAVLGETGGAFWSSHDWHVAHCMFYWQKYNRMRTTGVVMEVRFDSLAHVKHCTKLVLGPRPTYFFLLEVPVSMNSSVDHRPESSRVSGELPWPDYNALFGGAHGAEGQEHGQEHGEHGEHGQEHGQEHGEHGHGDSSHDASHEEHGKEHEHEESAHDRAQDHRHE